MIYQVLAIVGGGTTAAALGAIVWLAYKLARGKDVHLADLKAASKASNAARDHIERQDEALDGMTRDRDALTVELATKTKELQRETALRKSVEVERNNAYEDAREQVVALVRKANVADANRILADLLSVRLSKAVPRSEEPTAGDGLLKPDEL